MRENLLSEPSRSRISFAISHVRVHQTGKNYARLAPGGSTPDVGAAVPAWLEAAVAGVSSGGGGGGVATNARELRRAVTWGDMAALDAALSGARHSSTLLGEVSLLDKPTRGGRGVFTHLPARTLILSLDFVGAAWARSFSVTRAGRATSRLSNAF